MGYIGLALAGMEHRIETTRMGYCVQVKGLRFRRNGRENGNYPSSGGFYRDFSKDPIPSFLASQLYIYIHGLWLPIVDPQLLVRVHIGMYRVYRVRGLGLVKIRVSLRTEDWGGGTRVRRFETVLLNNPKS